MQRRIVRRVPRIVALVVLGALAAGPALAQGRGQDKHDNGNKHAEQQRGGGDRDGRGGPARFADDQREIVRLYYDTEVGRGHCPPGLAKKNNGCLPPGQAKKRYTVGRPLPRDVIFYEVPPPIVVQLGPPPRGYRYVRVSNDILMLAVGTGMVVDALENLGIAR